MKTSARSQRGFVALMSVIVITTILLVALGSAGLVNFYARFNALDFELKERSRAAADACLDRALVYLAQSGNPDGMTFTLNRHDECRVASIDITANTVRVQATSSNAAVTNLVVEFDPDDFFVASLREIPTL